MPGTTQQAMDFLDDAHHGPLVYRRMCLRLAREARGIPSRYYTAHDAAFATPQANRVSWSKLQRGHVGYFGKPGDANTADHVATCAGRGKDNRLRWWTNDAVRSGGVDKVVDPSPGASWFGTYWDEPFMWGADWLNGYAFTVGDTFQEWSGGPVYLSKLHQGQQNSDSVRRLQYRLNHHKVVVGDVAVTGNYGPETAERVARWQRQVAAAGPNDGSEVTQPQAYRLFGDAFSVRARTP